MAKKTEAQQKAQNKYMEKIARTEVVMPIEKKKKLREHASRRGESVNGFINRAIDETMQKDKAEE